MVQFVPAGKFLVQSRVGQLLIAFLDTRLQFGDLRFGLRDLFRQSVP